jgi:hypothetical protein
VIPGASNQQSRTGEPPSPSQQRQQQQMFSRTNPMPTSTVASTGTAAPKTLSNSSSASQLSVVVTPLAAPLKLQRLTGGTSTTPTTYNPRVVAREEMKSSVLTSSASQPSLGSRNTAASTAAAILTPAQRTTQQLIAQAQQLAAAVVATPSAGTAVGSSVTSSGPAMPVPVNWATKKNAHMLGALVSGKPIGTTSINRSTQPNPNLVSSSTASLMPASNSNAALTSSGQSRSALLVKESIRAFNV